MRNKKLYVILLLGVVMVGWFIYDKLTLSCDEIYKIEEEKSNKINISCKSDADCVVAPRRGCGVSCMNKNTDSVIIEGIQEVWKAGWKKDCYAVFECVKAEALLPLTAKCKCINNVCQRE